MQLRQLLDPRAMLAGQDPVQHFDPEAPVEETPGWDKTLRRRYGWFITRLIRSFVRIDVDQRMLREVRNAAREGTLVYVMPYQRLFGYLYYVYLFARYGLPQPRFVNGIISLFWAPWLTFLTRVTWGREGWDRRDRSDGPQRLAAAVNQDHAALLFLARPPSLFGRSRAYEHDYMGALVRLQRDRERPILLVPLVLLFSRRSPEASPSLVDDLLGTVHHPGMLRELGLFLRSAGRAVVRIGQALSVREALRGREDRTPERMGAVLARRVRVIAAGEERMVLGPRPLTASELKGLVLRDVRLRAVLDETARERDRPVASVETEAVRCLDQIAANYNNTVVMALNWLLMQVWKRIYDGVVVDAEGLERVRDAARRGPLLMCPSHKSHVDYLVLSQVFYRYHLVPPHIAAGDNLSFWPLGPIFRRGGAFFLRRSFKGDPVYTATFRAYVKALQRHRVSQEFFLEGGRSRHGRLLAPRTGLLAMEVEAHLDGAADELMVVPVSIGYEKIIEQRGYARELEGGAKRKEDLTALLATPRVLSSRYGRMYITFAEPVSLREFLRRRGGLSERAADGGESPLVRDAVKALAYRILQGIQWATVVTASAVAATALLTHGKRGINRRVFLERCEAVLAFLRDVAGARISPVLRAEERTTREAACDEAVERFIKDGRVEKHTLGDDVVYAVPDGNRLDLEYLKNTVVSFFAGHALCALELRASTGGFVLREELRERVRLLSMVFKYEFVYRTEGGYDAVLKDTLRSLEALGLVRLHDDRIQVMQQGRAQLGLIADTIRGVVESYYLVFCEAATLAESAVEAKELEQRLQARGRLLFLEGTLQHYESISRTNFTTALRALVDLGVLEEDDSHHLRLSQIWQGEAARAELASEFARYLGLPGGGVQ